jgi:predicted MPP superfamily phosphohydrolase
MKRGMMTRRRFLWASGVALAAPAVCWADAVWLEPHWVNIRTIRLGGAEATHRIVHITDIHHKGDRPYLEGVVARINRLAPDAVCFTGDLIEEARFIPETLEILQQLRCPLYGVPGNHDYWSRASFSVIGKAFAATGGEWLMDRQALLADGKIQLTGMTCRQGRPAALAPKPGVKNIALLHYPLMAERVPHRYDLMLAGHSHGGQVRLPIYGAFVLPYWVGKYDLGMFQLPAGPLYVNPGLGWLMTPLRFNCRPEITVFEI